MMSSVQNNRVLLVAGEGGHLEQARRFSLLDDSKPSSQFLVVTDEQRGNISFETDVIRMNNISALTKHRTASNLIKFFPKFIWECVKVFRLIRKVKPSGIIAFGPIFCLPFIVFGRLLGVKTVYIETWSRFYSPSITARLSKRFADKLYVQNESLKEQLEGSEYGGRL